MRHSPNSQSQRRQSLSKHLNRVEYIKELGDEFHAAFLGAPFQFVSNHCQFALRYIRRKFGQPDPRACRP